MTKSDGVRQSLFNKYLKKEEKQVEKNCLSSE